MLRTSLKTHSLSPFGTFQKTLKDSCTCQGVGVHSGLTITLVLRPAPENTGIVFKRVDVMEQEQSLIPARLQSVVDTRMCTTIGNSYGVTVGTVEHLMAALYACEIDNVVVELDGPEIPIMDGSAQPFVDMMDHVGVDEQDAFRSYIRVIETIELQDDHGGVAVLRPSDTPLYKSRVDFKGRADFGDQVFSFDGTPASFKGDISRARTFGFYEDAEKVWAMGLAKGSSLENTVVIQDNQVINEGGLRFATEFARHKILDTVGDFYIAGAPLLAEFEGVNCGHTLNNKMLQSLFFQCSRWEFVTPSAVVSSTTSSFRPTSGMKGFQPALARG